MSDMNNAINDPKHPTRDILPPRQPHPSRCEHEYEVIAHEEEGGTLRVCTKCKSLESE
jgi:hypothetical protein